MKKQLSPESKVINKPKAPREYDGSDLFACEPKASVFSQKSITGKLISPKKIQKLHKKTKLAKNKYEKQIYESLKQPITKILGRTLEGKKAKDAADLMKQLRSLVESNHLEEFFALLGKKGFIDETKEYGMTWKSKTNQSVDAFYAFAQLLFNPEKNNEETLFNVANKFFNYSFNPTTHQQCTKMLKGKDTYLQNYLLYAVIMECLVFKGWTNWTKETLVALKALSEKGNRVKYIAGGCDIEMLIKHGIYNIDVIDPIHPAQREFYNVNNFKILINGALDDEIILKFKNKNYNDVILKRAAYEENGEIEVNKSSRIKITLPQSKTTWAVHDKKTDKKLGTVIFDRRYSTEKDFTDDKKSVLLLSFNELSFIANGEWGFTIDHLSDETKIFIKQLFEPVNKHVALNLANIKKTAFFKDYDLDLGYQAS